MIIAKILYTVRSTIYKVVTFKDPYDASKFVNTLTGVRVIFFGRLKQNNPQVKKGLRSRNRVDKRDGISRWKFSTNPRLISLLS